MTLAIRLTRRNIMIPARIASFLLSSLLLGWVGALVAFIQPALAQPQVGYPISPPGTEASAPTVAIDRQGRVHGVWKQPDGLWHRYQQQGQWSAPQRVADEGEDPTLVADPYGDAVYLAWSQEFNGNYDIFTRMWDPQQGWALPQNVSDNDGGSYAPTWVMGPDGRFHLFWADTTPGDDTIYHAVSADGKSWPVALPVPQAQGAHPAAGFDASGTLHLVWQYRADFTQNLRLWTAQYQDDAWSSPQALTDGSQQAYGARMAQDHGALALVWQEGDQARLAQWNQDTWHMQARQTGREPVVALTFSQGLWWAWQTSSGLARQFRLRTWSDPQFWAGATSGQPDAAAQGARIGMVWVEDQGAGPQVFYLEDHLTATHLPLFATP